MGSRGQVLIEDTGVYLYTHWDADGLVDLVKSALSSEPGNRRLRDPDYLARIIFDDMVGSRQGGETGFGIGTDEAEDIEVLVVVNCTYGTVTVKYLNEDDEVFLFSSL